MVDRFCWFSCSEGTYPNGYVLIPQMSIIVSVLLVQRTVTGCMSVTVTATVADVAATDTNAAVSVSVAQVLVFGIDLRMVGMTDLLDDRIESVVLVGSVFNDARCSVRLLQRVTTFMQRSGGYKPNSKSDFVGYGNAIDRGAIW